LLLTSMDALMTFFNLPLNCELYCTPPKHPSDFISSWVKTCWLRKKFESGLWVSLWEWWKNCIHQIFGGFL